MENGNRIVCCPPVLRGGEGCPRDQKLDYLDLLKNIPTYAYSSYA